MTNRFPVYLDCDAEALRPFFRTAIGSGRVRVTIESEHGTARAAFEVLSADKGAGVRAPMLTIVQAEPLQLKRKRVRVSKAVTPSTNKTGAASNPQAAPAEFVTRPRNRL